MTWTAGPFLSFDVESTGVDVDTDRIVTATVVRIHPGHDTTIRSTVINPGVPVPDGAAEIHGWTTEQVQAEGKPPEGELEWIAADLADAFRAGTPVVIANAPYDLTILDRELRRHRLPAVTDRLNGSPLAPVIDPMVLDKRVDRYRRGKRRLENLCAHYGVRLDGAHDATADALAAARVAYQIARRYPEIGNLTLPELHAAQVGWYAEQTSGLAAWWRQKANELEHQAQRAGDGAREDLLAEAEDLRVRADGVSTAWPMRPYEGGAVR